MECSDALRSWFRLGRGELPRGLAALAAGLLVMPACAEVEPVDPPGGELGTVDFPTSCTETVQPDLERGLALIHHMMYHEAEPTFQRAVRAEEECAMAHWGLAMSRFQPFWGSADLQAGRAAAERAVALEAPTGRERLYARAALAFFEGDDLPYGDRVRMWEAAMAELHEAFPDDPEAAALYALAHLSVAPGDPEHQERADVLVRRVHEALPRHPGAIHYGIHVHDVEARAEDGVHFARAYEDIAPTLAHALHMPSHIYVRTGDWDEVIAWNRESADAALDHPAGDHVSLHYPHALDYLMYGHLQKGEDGKAREILEELRLREGYEPHLASAYALAAIPARWHVERRDWGGAAELEARVPGTFPWESFPAAEAMIWFARGLGAARTGDVERAAAAMERLAELEEALHEADDHYWAEQVRVQRRSVRAWKLFAEGRPDEAIETMAMAAAVAGEMEKHPITPGDLQPATELLGDLLLEADRPDRALEAFEATLETWPRRYHSLLGAARAADEAGRSEVARLYFAELATLAADADTDREGVAEARARAQIGTSGQDPKGRPEAGEPG